MMFDFELAKRMECSDSEKDKAWKWMDVILSLAEQSRREGLLALEDRRDTLETPLLREGIRLVLDGYELNVVRDVLFRLVAESQARGGDLLSRVVQAEGVLLIHQGMSPRGIVHSLAAFFGETYGVPKALETEKKMDDTASAVSEEYPPLSIETSLLEDVVPALTEVQILSWVSETETSDLTLALKGAGSGTVHRILGVLSDRSRGLILEDLTLCGPLKIADIVEAQKKILVVLKKLEGN